MDYSVFGKIDPKDCLVFGEINCLDRVQLCENKRIVHLRSKCHVNLNLKKYEQNRYNYERFYIDLMKIRKGDDFSSFISQRLLKLTLSQNHYTK